MHASYLLCISRELGNLDIVYSSIVGVCIGGSCDHFLSINVHVHVYEFAMKFYNINLATCLLFS